jgi:hypothetical protein
MRGYLATLLLLCGLTTAAPAEAHPPYALVADPQGNVYFSDLETVWRLSPDGQLSLFRPHVPQTHVHALALAQDGAIVGDQNRYDPAADRFYSGLWRRSLQGVERPLVPMTERPPAGSGVWHDKSGNRYTSQWLSSADRRMVLLRRRPNGSVDVLFDESGGLPRPPQPTVESVGGMAFSADGSLFFTNGSVLRRLSPTGRVAKLYDGGSKSSLRGLAAAPDGRVLAADMGEKTVVAIAPDGSVSTLYREMAAWSPTAVALAGGRLLVLEANEDPYQYEDRVRVVEVVDHRGTVVASPAHPQVGQAPSAPSSIGKGSPNTRMKLLVALAASAALVAAAWWFLRLRYGNASS